MRRKYYILDTDIGSDIDDAMALLLCLRTPDFPLVAVTTVYNRVELRARIAKKMLAIEGRDVPVGIGIGDPMDELGFLWETGLEGEGLLLEEDKFASLSELDIIENGIDLLIETARKHSGMVEIISIGQFTNIATAIQKVPDLATHVSRIWSMSGGVNFPSPIPDNFPDPNMNYIAIPSHNIRIDAKAANIVLKSGIPITFVGNDVTTQVIFEQTDISRIAIQGSPLNEAVMRMMAIWFDYRTMTFGREITKTCLHDALVVAEAIGMEFTRKLPIDISIDEVGMTIVKLNPESKNEICWSVDADSFVKWYMKTVCQK